MYLIANDANIKLEAVLDYIIERKRLDDLSKSIIDGRYNEQKVNLKFSSNRMLKISHLFF